MKGIEAFRQDLVECDQSRRIIPFQEGVHKGETVFIIKDIEVAQDILIPHIRAAESHCLVKDSQSVSHGSVSLMGYHMK